MCVGYLGAVCAITIAINVALLQFTLILICQFGRILCDCNGIFNNAQYHPFGPVSLETNQMLIAEGKADRKCWAQLPSPECSRDSE